MKKLFVIVSSFILLVISIIHEFALAQNNEMITQLTPQQKLAREIFRELIEIKTTKDMGCTQASEILAQRLKMAGFPEKDIHIIGPEVKHKNLVFRYHGKGSFPPILFIGHLDVVDALRQDWSVDPFQFSENGGYFYGRGTSDMKSDAAALISNLIRFKQEGFIPNRDIIIALTDGEENAGEYGIQWIIKNHWELINAEYCINLDSGGGMIKNGKHLIMNIQTCEKLYFDYELEVKNKGGHSALPVKDNAIYRLADALGRLARFDFPLKLNETTRSFFERNAIQEIGQTKTDMIAMRKEPMDTIAANRLAKSSPHYNSLMRTTCVATMLSGGHAENALPQTARAIINCRMLPDDTPENVLATLKYVIADTLVKITCKESSKLSPISPIRNDVMNSLERVTSRMWPGVIVIPCMLSGASDGAFIRSAGIPVYGISGVFADMDDIRAHGKDERVGVKEFYDGFEFMHGFIKALTTN